MTFCHCHTVIKQCFIELKSIKPQITINVHDKSPINELLHADKRTGKYGLWGLITQHCI